MRNDANIRRERNVIINGYLRGKLEQTSRPYINMPSYVQIETSATPGVLYSNIRRNRSIPPHFCPKHPQYCRRTKPAGEYMKP